MTIRIMTAKMNQADAQQVKKRDFLKKSFLIRVKFFSLLKPFTYTHYVYNQTWKYTKYEFYINAQCFVESETL